MYVVEKQSLLGAPFATSGRPVRLARESLRPHEGDGSLGNGRSLVIFAGKNAVGIVPLCVGWLIAFVLFILFLLLEFDGKREFCAAFLVAIYLKDISLL